MCSKEVFLLVCNSFVEWICVMVAQITFKVAKCEIARECFILKKKSTLE